MSYESWRISYQSSEQAARAAYAKVEELAARLAELEGQEPVAWVEVVSTHEGPYNFEGMALLGKGTHLLYARPVPAEPVNARLLAIATGQLQHIYSDNCPDPVSGLESRDPKCPACQAIAVAEAHQAEPVRLTEAEIGRIDRQSREGIKSLMSTWPVPLARAIEDAVLERNGLKPQAKGD